MTFTSYLKTILSDLFCATQPNKNSHVQRHGNKADGPNGSQKGSCQHKTVLPPKGHHHGTSTITTTQKKTHNRYLPPNPPAPPPNSPRPRPIRLPQNPPPAPPPSPRPRPIRLPQNPPPAPPPSPRPRPIRLGFPSGEPQANNTAQVEAPNNIPHHSSSASAPATSRPPLNINKPLPPVPLFQHPMFPFPITAFIAQSQGPAKGHAKGYAQAQAQKTQSLQQQQQETEQETEFLTLLTLLEKALRHTHYAVCGRAALYVWGYRPQQPHSSSPPPEKVSIVCPDGNEAIISSWAKAQGWTSVVSSAKGCSFEVPIPSVPGNGGKVAKVREVVVKTAERMGLTLPNFGDGDGDGMGGMGMPMAVKGTWAEAEKKVLKTQAAVVTLPALLGMLIEGFVTEITQPETEAGQRSRVEEAAKVILWVLGRLVERGERLSQDKVPEEFLTPFLAVWPEAHALLEELGVSTFELDRDEDELQPKSEPGVPLDAVTLAALEGLPSVPSVPPVPPKALERTTSPASSCGSANSEDTIALIENEIELWNQLSMEEESETSSQVSRAETAESSGVWTSACSSSSLATSVALSASSFPALSVSASSCSSKKSGTQSSSGRGIKCVPPPWQSAWDERMVRKGQYPKWI